MLTLYYKQTCPFSARVLQVADNLQVTLELKDVAEDSVFEQEMLEKGGKSQVPFLVDSERGVSMYDSNDIIEHLRAHYANKTPVAVAARPRVHISSSVCESCEG